MKIVTDPKKMTLLVREARRQGKRIGFVPTLGALHDGHATLMAKARKENDIVVVSTFVNPLQFRKAAYERYPRDPEGDRALCEKAGVDYLFAPSAEKMYPERFDTVVEVKELTGRLEGAAIRWHYRGVTTVVAKLFAIVEPDKAYFGKKDPHQLAILKRMTEDLNIAVQIVPVATKRDRDGMALSSRNRLLTPESRKAALALPKAVAEIERRIKAGETDRGKLTEALTAMLSSAPGVTIDFAAIVDAETLREEDRSGPTLIYAAVFVDGLRLTDNRVV
ncbi:MAG: pantoate--beta-alanine ligase [Nitrospinae bacterium]|nr:pantoate--beta-alanine ligase [Nitrospinota bacterium]